MKAKRILQGIAGAFACGYLWMMTLFCGGLVAEYGFSVWLSGLIMASLNAIYFAVGNAPLWIFLGLVAAWRVPKLAAQSEKVGSWLRTVLEGAALGTCFMLIFSLRIAYGFYHDGQYRSVGDLLGRFNENFFALQTPLALLIFAVWLNEWCRRAESCGPTALSDDTGSRIIDK